MAKLTKLLERCQLCREELRLLSFCSTPAKSQTVIRLLGSRNPNYLVHMVQRSKTSVISDLVSCTKLLRMNKRAVMPVSALLSESHSALA